jgi:hypothetical protein
VGQGNGDEAGGGQRGIARQARWIAFNPSKDQSNRWNRSEIKIKANQAIWLERNLWLNLGCHKIKLMKSINHDVVIDGSRDQLG